MWISLDAFCKTFFFYRQASWNDRTIDVHYFCEAMRHFFYFFICLFSLSYISAITDRRPSISFFLCSLSNKHPTQAKPLSCWAESAHSALVALREYRSLSEHGLQLQSEEEGMERCALLHILAYSRWLLAVLHNYKHFFTKTIANFESAEPWRKPSVFI